MAEVLAWNNLIFIVPLIIGACLVFVAGMGSGDLEGDLDVDANADAETDGEVGSFAKFLGLLGIGKCPLSIILMCALVIFGVTGLILNQMIGTSLVLMSIGIAFVTMLFLTRLIAAVVAKIMPSTETYVSSAEHMCGLTGKVVVKVTTSYGQVDAYDHRGDLHRLRCKTYKGEIPSGKQVIVVEHKQGFFMVEEYKEG